MSDPLPPLTCEQARLVDRIAIDERGISGLDLMETAGTRCAELLRSRTGGPVAICCGKGNNGGDGFVIARRLLESGVDVQVLLADQYRDDLSADARVNFERLDGEKLPIVDELSCWPDHLSNADWIVDALLGSGTAGAPRPPLDAAIEMINASSRPVFAVDLPSGLDADTGEHPGVCVQASVTATFMAPKVGFASKAAAGTLGLVEVVDIGVPDELVREAIRRTASASPSGFDDPRT